MHFEFATKALAQLYYEEKGAHRYPANVVESFFDVMATIEAAVNESDIRAFKWSRYEKLKGDRQGQISLRLNDQYRLIIEIKKDANGKDIWVIEIADYHK